MKRVRAIYQGRVQGVGFRWACLSSSQPFEVTGIVRNEPDGTVLLEAQGEKTEVDAFFQAIAERMAQNIKGVSIHDIPLQASEHAFQIER